MKLKFISILFYKQKNKVYTIACILLLFVNSCAQEMSFNDIEFNKMQTFSFKYPGEFSVKNIQYIGNNKVMVNIYSSNKLYLLDIADNGVKLTDSIEIRNVEVNQIQGFHYINNDSIFVLLGTMYEDTALILINSKGKVIRNNYLHHPQLYKMYANSGFYPHIYFFNNLIVSNHKIVMPVYFVPYTRYPFASKSFYEHPYPLVAYYDLHADSITFENKIWYSFLKRDFYYPDNMRYVKLSQTASGNILIAFPYALTFQEYDLNNKTLKNIKFKSNLIDTILPLKEPLSLDERKNFLEFKIKNILYDPYAEQYYINIGTCKYYEYKNILVVTDKNFNTLGETFFPKLAAYNLCFTEKYLYSIDFDYKKSSVIVEIFERPQFVRAKIDSIKTLMNKLKEKSMAMIQEEAKCSNVVKSSGQESIIHYFKKNGIKDLNFYAICFYSDICPGCIETILKNLAYNLNYYNKLPLYLIIQGKNTEQIRYKIKMEGLSSFNKLFIDSIAEYEKYDPYTEKSTRIVNVRNGEVYFDKNYLPGYQKDLFMKLDSLLKE